MFSSPKDEYKYLLTSAPFCVILKYNKQKEYPMRYRVVCPSAPFENTETNDIDRAADLCYGLAEEYGSAEVRQYNLNGSFFTIMEY